jgi:4-diphosphocytidyl-2-C-methyl-D-erythritol kinase
VDRAEVGGTPVSITLAKRVPVGAGLGGGSSDAAFTLVGLNRLWGAGWTADRLSEFAARFGSDVPFFVAASLGAPSAACLGRGEIVRPVPRPAPGWALLVLPPFPLSTRDVYARFDEMGLGFEREVSEAPDWPAWASLEARDLLPRLVNDLEPAAFALSPELAALRAAAEQTAGRIVRMSGSGSSLFTLFDAGETDAARTAADEVSRRHGVRVELVDLCPALADDAAA